MKATARSIFAAAISVLLFAGSPVVAQIGDWPQWRGADRSNASKETGLLQKWPQDGPPLLWKVTGLGEGIHSVSVANGRVFTVGNREGGEYVFALDAKTGEKLWATRTGDAIEEQALMRWLTQRTPTVDGDRVYSFSSKGELFCLNSADGKKLWERSYTKDFGSSLPQWGFCDRPLVEGEQLICTPFGSKAFITALDKRNGAIIWETGWDMSPHAGYGSLVVSEAGGVRQYVVFSMGELSGFAAEDGRLLWHYPRMIRFAATYTPIVSGDFIVSPNSYGTGIVGLQLVKPGDEFQVRPVYTRNGASGDPKGYRFDPFGDATAQVGDFMYFIDGFKSDFKPACLELKTGDLQWKGEALPHLGRSALTYADQCIYFRDSQGMMFLMNVSPSGFKMAGQFKVPEYQPSLGVTAPVVAGGRLYLRDSNRLFCYDISADAMAKPHREPLQAGVGLTSREMEETDNAPRAPHIGVNRAPDAVYIPTPQDVTERMLEEADVKKGDVVVDLGSGDGRILITAAKKYGCIAIGYEIDPRLVELSRKAIAKEHLQELVMVQHADIFDVDFSRADVVTAFLYPRLMERLIPQFEKLKPGSRIVSHQFELPGVKPNRDLTVDSEETGQTHRILLWNTPLKKQ